MPPLSKTTVDTIRRLVVGMGLSFSEAARQTGVNVASVSRLAKREGWPKRAKIPEKVIRLSDHLGEKQKNGKSKDSDPVRTNPDGLDPRLIDTAPLAELAQLMVRFAVKELTARPSVSSLGLILNAGLAILKGIDAPKTDAERLEVVSQIRSQIKSLESILPEISDPHDKGEIPQSSKEDAG